MPRDRTGHFYYSWFPTIYQQDTQHLSLHEDGAYRRLIDHYMLTRAPLPADDRALARIVGVGLTEWESLKPIVMSYFKPTGFSYEHTFCETVLQNDRFRIEKSRSNGGKGGRPRSRKTKTITHPVSEVEPNGKLNITKLNKESKSIKPPTPLLPDWVPRDQWDGYLGMRMKMRKPMTDMAKRLAISELERLREDGHDPGKVLEQSIMKGWSGLFALKGTGPPQPGKLDLQRKLINEARREIFHGEPN